MNDVPIHLLSENVIWVQFLLRHRVVQVIFTTDMHKEPAEAVIHWCALCKTINNDKIFLFSMNISNVQLVSLSANVSINDLSWYCS